MKTSQLEQFAAAVVGEPVKILILENQAAKIWYEKKYVPCDRIEPNTRYYATTQKGYPDAFEFKTGKNEDNFFKTFVTQYVSKVPQYAKGRELTKEEKLSKVIERNQDRVNFGLLYTTLYGFGLFTLFCNTRTKERVETEVNNFLASNGIRDVSHEYSDAAWVYRFKFKQPIEKINALLEKFQTGRDSEALFWNRSA